MAGAGAGAVAAACSVAESCTGTMVGDAWCTMGSVVKGEAIFTNPLSGLKVGRADAYAASRDPAKTSNQLTYIGSVSDSSSL